MQIDYESFKIEVVTIIPDFYTDVEIQNILNEYSNRPNVPITKYSFRQQLAVKSQYFVETNFLNQVNTILTNSGYMPL